MSANLSALIAATVVLLLIPGPNVAIIVATSLRDGLKYGLITTFGTTAGLALQLALVVIGMAALIEAAAATLSWIKWAGVVYLVWLGVRTRNEPAADLADAKIVSRTVTFWRGFGLAVVNPKTLYSTPLSCRSSCRRATMQPGSSSWWRASSWELSSSATRSGPCSRQQRASI